MNESILTKDFLSYIGTEGLVIGIMTMIGFYIGYQESPLLAMTMAFGTLCTSRLVHGFNCKSVRPVLFTKKFFNNIYLIGAFVLGLVLITSVLMIPGLHKISACRHWIWHSFHSVRPVHCKPAGYPGAEMGTCETEKVIKEGRRRGEV